MAVHKFVHLNLAIALFVGYFIFAIGVELGSKNEVHVQVPEFFFVLSCLYNSLTF